MILASCSSPPPVPQWTDTGGPVAQDVTALLIDSRSPGNVFAGHADGAVSRSTDDGRTWEVLSRLDGQPAVLFLLHHPEQSRLMYAGTSRGPFRTTDGGKSWSAMPVDPASPQAPCPVLAFDPINPSELYAGVTGHGVYRSADGGNIWRQCDIGVTPDRLTGSDVTALAVSPADPNLVIASLSRSGLLRSTDRGSTWTMLTRELAASGTIPTALLLHPRLRDAICFGTQAGDIYRTVNGGATWSPTRQGTHSRQVGSLLSVPGEADRILGTSGDGVLTSTDFGATWSEIGSNLPRIPSRLTLTPAGNGLLMFVYGQGIGVERSTDGGGSWQPADRGLGSSIVTGLAIRPGTTDIFATVGSSLHLFNRGRASWIPASSGLTGEPITSLAFETPPDSLLYCATSTGLFRSADGGASWSSLPRTFGPYPVEFFDTHLSIRTRMFTGTPAGLFVSTDRGRTWKPTRPQGEQFRIRSLVFAASNAGVVHAATYDRGILGSEDGGLSWEFNRYGIRSADILGITRDRDNDRLMYCFTAGGEGYRSTNRGMEWDVYTPPWKAGDRVVLWIARNAPHRAMALVNERTVYSTSTAGATWKSLIVEPLPAEAGAILWSAPESALYAGTLGRGVFRLGLPPELAPGQD